MQFTATGTVADVLKSQTMEAKSPGDLVYVLGTTRNELGGSAYYDLFGYTGLNVPKVEPEQFLALYRAVERAIAEGLVASCRGIYRGGLAIHAAMTAMGGQLGMTIDLGKIPGSDAADIRDDQLLFSESCGRFLVTVPENKPQCVRSALQRPAVRSGRQSHREGRTCDTGEIGKCTAERRCVGASQIVDGEVELNVSGGGRAVGIILPTGPLDSQRWAR